MYEDTNPWAAYFAAQKEKDAEARKKAQERAAKTRAYKEHKPQPILALEAAYAKQGTRKVWDDRTANGLTDFALDYLRFKGYYAARINTGGNAMGATGAGGKEVLKWATSKSTKGVADVIACIKGRFCQFEIKAGKDRPREDQLKQQELTQKAGGVYVFIHNADELDQAVKLIEARTCINIR